MAAKGGTATAKKARRTGGKAAARSGGMGKTKAIVKTPALPRARSGPTTLEDLSEGIAGSIVGSCVNFAGPAWRKLNEQEQARFQTRAAKAIYKLLEPGIPNVMNGTTTARELARGCMMAIWKAFEPYLGPSWVKHEDQASFRNGIVQNVTDRIARYVKRMGKAAASGTAAS